MLLVMENGYVSYAAEFIYDFMRCFFGFWSMRFLYALGVEEQTQHGHNVWPSWV